MRSHRIFFFLLAILVGAGLGLYYGWVVNPARFVDTTPDTLRSDYQADFVLMVAEVYQADQDIEIAARRLALLGDTPVRLVQQAIVTAEDLGYTLADIEQMAQLSRALQFWTPAPEGP